MEVPLKAFSLARPATWLATEKRSRLFLGILFLSFLYFVMSKDRGSLLWRIGVGILSLVLGWTIARLPRWNAFTERMGRLWKNDLCIAAVVVVCMVVVLGVSPRAFLINDDIGILADIRGGFDVSYTSLILGRCLSVLYGLAPSIPFYGIFLYFMHAVSLYLFIKTFSSLRNLTPWFPFFLIAYFSLYAQFLMRVSFNNAALMIGINALMYCASRLMDGERRTAVFMLPGLAFTFCFIVRRQTLLGVLVFSAVILARLLRDKRSRRALAVFFVPLVLVILTDGLMARYGVSESYKAFQRFNSPRSRVDGYPILVRNKNNPRLLRANGWTKNDMTLFRRRFFPNEKKFNETTIKNFFTEGRRGLAIKPKDVLSRASFIIKGYRIQFFFLASLVVLAFFLLRSKEIKGMLLNAVYMSSGMVAMALVAKFPSRIGGPLSLLLLVSSVLFVFQGRTNAELRKPWNRPLSAFFTACCISILLLGGIVYVRRAKDLTSRLKKVETINQRLNAAYSGALFLTTHWPWSQERDPLKDPKDSYERIPYGWATFSERFYEVIERRVGVKKGVDLFPRFLRLKNAYIVGKTNFIKEKINHYLWENYRIRSKFVRVEKLDKDVGIFKVLIRRDGRRR